MVLVELMLFHLGSVQDFVSENSSLLPKLIPHAKMKTAQEISILFFGET